MAVEDIVRFFSENSRYSPKMVHTEVTEAGLARYGTPDFTLSDEISSYLSQGNIRLYSHQCSVVSHALKGRNVIVTTPTASGKTLAFNIPVFEQLIADPASRALYLYPTKALTNDQLGAIARLNGFTGVNARPAVYDGDTPQSQRAMIRDNSRIVLTNPHELHHILAWHTRWRDLFSHLEFVVIDEAHRYRGIFGSHIALLVRRLVRLCRHHGSDPQFILSTATLANPLDFAERLTGKKFELVDNDGAPHGRKHFLLYNPYYDGLGDRSMHQETKDFLLSCVSGNLQTLCFTGSRKMAELITLRAREDFPGAAKDRTDAIVAYRAGYLPEERRGIEQDIRNGIIRGIVSTNALELGIDIGSLDAVILSGYPGTMMSTWQQAGRAGRSGSDSLAILVAQSNPLDQYFIHHPEQFFSRSHEHAIIDTQNPYVLSGHLLCAASEIPVDEVRDTEFFGGSILSFLHEFASGDIVRKTGRGWVYSGRGRAADLVRLDGIPGETFRILCHGKVLETMGRAQAYREAHPGAILLHQGETYCAGEMDLATHTIRVAPANVDYYTQALKEVRLDIVSTHLEKEVHGARAYFGEVEVTERYTGYKIKRGDTIIGVEPLTLPPIRFRTKAFWIVPMASTEQKVMSASYDLAGGLHGVEHALIAIMPLHVVCDRWDLGGLSSPAYGEEGSPVIFVYDGFEGGIGLSEKAFVLLPEILATTYELVRDCQCTDGCPSCIQSPKCGNDNHPLDKNAAEMILGDLAMEKNTEAPNNARIHELAAS